MKDHISEYLRMQGMPFLENEPLSRHTSFHIGGPARFFVIPGDEGQLTMLMAFIRELGAPYAVIGNGSNLLVADEGFPGVVIRAPEWPIRWVERREVEVSAGFSLSRMAQAMAEDNLGDITFAQGIPGSVGGAVVMNAGAYGRQISDILVSSRALTPQGMRVLTAAEHRFGYRHSIYQEHPDWILTSARFHFIPTRRATLEEQMADFAQRRRASQPLEYPSAGSVFKRPEGHFAGQLIERCGLKGYRIGDAQVSEKHAGFIVNRGEATCAQVLELMEHIQKTVLDQTGVRLEPEIRVLK